MSPRDRAMMGRTCRIARRTRGQTFPNQTICMDELKTKHCTFRTSFCGALLSQEIFKGSAHAADPFTLWLAFRLICFLKFFAQIGASSRVSGCCLDATYFAMQGGLGRGSCQFCYPNCVIWHACCVHLDTLGYHPGTLGTQKGRR